MESRGLRGGVFTVHCRWSQVGLRWVDRNPTFAVGRDQGDAWHRAAATLRAFRASYQAALDRWRAGVRDAAFPAGTWLMRVFHHAVVADMVTADGACSP